MIFHENGWEVLNRILEPVFFPFIAWICYNLKHIIIDFKHEVLEFWDREELKCTFKTEKNDEKSKNGKYRSRLEISTKLDFEFEWVYGESKENAEKNLCQYFYKHKKEIENSLFKKFNGI